MPHFSHNFFRKNVTILLALICAVFSQVCITPVFALRFANIINLLLKICVACDILDLRQNFRFREGVTLDPERNCGRGRRIHFHCQPRDQQKQHKSRQSGGPDPHPGDRRAQRLYPECHGAVPERRGGQAG